MMRDFEIYLVALLFAALTCFCTWCPYTSHQYVGEIWEARALGWLR
jgi:hypothetical protein